MPRCIRGITQAAARAAALASLVLLLSEITGAVRAGADSIEHRIDIDDETFASMKKQGTRQV